MDEADGAHAEPTGIHGEVLVICASSAVAARSLIIRTAGLAPIALDARADSATISTTFPV